MEHSFLRKFGILLLCGTAGLVMFLMFYSDVAPSASLDFKYTRSEIMEKGREYLQGLGYDLKDYQQDANFNFDSNNQLYLQLRHGMREANAIIRADTLSIHAWELFWFDPKVTQSQSLESFKVWISPAGHVLGFSHTIQDSVELPSLSKEEAQKKAENFLRGQNVDLSNYFLKTSSSTQRPKRIDHRFEWSMKDSTVTAAIWINILGNDVGGYHLDLEPSTRFKQMMSVVATNATFLATASFTAMFLLFFFVVILFLKKYHDGEVGTNTGLLVFIGMYVLYVLNACNVFETMGYHTGMGDLNKLNVRWVMFGIMVFIFYVFMSVLVFAGWSVGESSSRSTWPKKLTAVDGALFRKFFTLDLAEGVVRGYAWGLILLGAYVLFFVMTLKYTRTASFGRTSGGVAEAFIPSLHPILNNITTAALSEILFRLFFISYIKEKTKKLWLGVLISTLIWTVTGFTMWDSPFGSTGLTFSFASVFVFGLAFCFLFLRYDLLTAIVANFIVMAMNDSIPLMTSSSPSFQHAWWIFLGLLAVPLGIAVAGFARKQRFEFEKESMPAHIQRISERERMAKELEIARRVQMSLLPKSSPKATGYDIAGTCIPAMEVGGDYYDFVNLGGTKIGIAIGDVSGKGVPAAIYMTLTKGILQSHAEENVSPKSVLSKVNSLMYRTIDRNSFVSMFYAILDMENRKIRFARAGQCPVIIAQRNNEKGFFLTPKGMALGLEVGTVFDSVLEEQEMDVSPGEVLVFYTDGFTEAMNEKEDEFGEERLVQSIARHRDKTASEIINAICKDVDSFTKGFQQHDDMTMVVVKVG